MPVYFLLLSYPFPGPLARERDLFFSFLLFVAMSGSELEASGEPCPGYMGGNKETQRIHSDAFWSRSLDSPSSS